MSEKTSEEHWKDKCARYLDSIVPVPARTAGPHLQRGQPPVFGQLPFRYRPKKRGNTNADVKARNDKFASQNGVRRLLLLSSAHGVPFMAYARSKRVCGAWFAVISCVVLAAVCAFTYVAWKYVNAAPELRMRYRNECCRQFPAVTICNNNLLRQSRLTGSRFTNLSRINVRRVDSLSTADEYVAVPMDRFETLSEFMRDKGVELNEGFIREIDQLNYIHNHVKHNNDWQELYEHAPDMRLMLHPSKTELEYLGHKESSLIVQCDVDGRPCHTRLRVRQLSHPLHGNCFTVNMDQIGKIPTPATHFGRGSGLRLVLDAEVAEYVDLLTDIDGVRVFVHPRRDQFYDHDYTLATPGHAAFIGVTQIVSTVNSGPCNNDVTYSMKKCVEGCLDRLTELYCGCSFLPLTDAEARCNAFKQTQYICKEALLKLHAEDKFKCDCQKPCSFTDYSVKEHAITTWPSSSHVDQVVAQLSRSSSHADKEYIRNNVIMVNVFMSSLEYEERIEVDSYEWLSLLADVGGISALFLGVSLLSLLEFVYILFHAIFRRGCCRRDGPQGHKNRVRYAEGFDAIPSDLHKSTAYTINHHAANRQHVGGNQPAAVPMHVVGLNDVYLPEGAPSPEVDTRARAVAGRAPPIMRQASMYRRAFRQMDQTRPYERVHVPVRNAPALYVPQRPGPVYGPRRPCDDDARSDTLGYDLPRFRHLRPMAPVSRQITM